MANGFIENNQVLTEDPFRSVGSIIDLFDIQQVHKLVGRINEKNRSIFLLRFFIMLLR